MVYGLILYLVIFMFRGDRLYQTLYRKWRPRTFSDVCGQDHVTKILRHEVETDKLSHAYLFCGSRGTGKTTCAKILAKALNCENPENGNPCGKCPCCTGIESGQIVDIIEMDAASNNGVDNIREIRDDVAYAPSAVKKKVFIIDEVHMLSISAFNALLKTLEEPPEHIVFILATTELHKIPATILSRCQRFDFRRIPTQTICERLRYIADEENIEIEDAALFLIARQAGGGMRDAIGMLELCSGSLPEKGSVLTEMDVSELLGVSNTEMLLSVIRSVQNGDLEGIFDIIAGIHQSSKDLAVFWQSLSSFYRDMLVIKSVPQAKRYVDLPDKQLKELRTLADGFSKETLFLHCRLLDEALVSMQKNMVSKRILAEGTLLRMCDPSLEPSNDALLARIAVLENRLFILESNGGKRPNADAREAADPVSPLEVSPAESQRKAENLHNQSRKSWGAVESSMRLFSKWPEVIRRMEASDPGVSAFLRSYKAYVDEENGKLCLYAGDSFSIKMVTASETLQRLCEAVNAECMGEQRYTMSDISVCEGERAGTQPEQNPIDEIIESAGKTE